MIGLDLAKNVFQDGIGEDGEIVVHKQLTRSQMQHFFVRLEPCLIGMEACGGAYHWSRTLTELGHTVQIIAPALSTLPEVEQE